MAESEHETPGVFDLERIRTLIELMRDHDIAEVDLREGEQRIRLARPSATPVPTTYALPHPPAQPPPVTTHAPAERSEAAAVEGANIVYIRSPMVGTFYGRPNPKAASFVKVGDHVEADTVVCIVEAMKMFNEIPAEVRGRIVAVLVEDEEPVDHGKPLFKVDTSG
jgi:acetyl-CoA carboxylase biotin carboxyl carrier protein